MHLWDNICGYAGFFLDLKFNITEHDMTAQSYERKVGDSHGLKKAYLGFQLGRVLEKEGKYCKKQTGFLLLTRRTSG